MDDSPLSREELAFALETFPDARVTALHVAYPDLDMLPEDTAEVVDASLDELDDVGDETAASVLEAVRDSRAGANLVVLTGESAVDSREIHPGFGPKSRKTGPGHLRQTPGQELIVGGSALLIS